MAEEGDEQRMSLAQEEMKSAVASSSDSENSDNEESEAPQIEWLATTRAKRSTAGNRMKSMLAAEEPDDELELLFAEDADDAGFTDVGEGDSDVQMDSSSDEEDAQNQGDDDEGEKELEKQARERKLAARKRKAQEAIPVKFRKKVRVDTTATSSQTATPVPRPKKKSERASWLPSPADMPTRASKRETTMLSKEALHQQMVEREAKRLKLMEAMERKAKRMEALKKPPMTQAERLAEAAKVEKRNAKSLNRWEEAEKQREEERKAKLAALNNRQLSGPVVTFWSGMGEWVDGKLKYLGKSVTIEEKPIKKRLSAIGAEKSGEGSVQEELVKDGQTVNNQTPAIAALTPAIDDKATESPVNGAKTPVIASSEVTSTENLQAPTAAISQPENTDLKLQDSSTSESGNLETPLLDGELKAPDAKPIEPESKNPPTEPKPQQITPEPKPQQTTPSGSKPQQTTPEAQPAQATSTNIKPPDMRPPDLQPPDTGPYTTTMFAPPIQTPGPVMKPPEMRPPTNSFLAPPPGTSGLSMPMLGYSSHPPSSRPPNGLAAPSTIQRQSPLSMPKTDAHQPPPMTSMVPPAPSPQRPMATPSTVSFTKTQRSLSRPASKPSNTLKTSHANASKKAKEQPGVPDLPPSPRSPPPPDMKATCNSIILQNFDEDAIEQKSIQQRILFGRETGKLAKPPPLPKCIITNKVARYKDPKTGLPYYDSRAYKEIQKLQRGDYKWSQLVGAWVGTSSFAAQGVPARFLDPNAPAPPRPAPTVKQEPAAATTAVTAAPGPTQAVATNPTVTAPPTVTISNGAQAQQSPPASLPATPSPAPVKTASTFPPPPISTMTPAQPAPALETANGTALATSISPSPVPATAATPSANIIPTTQ